MNQAQLRTPWEFSKALLSLAPVASVAAQNHAGIDRSGYTSAIVDILYTVTGAPTGGSLTVQMQDSADGVTFANYGAATVVAITGNVAGALASQNVRLEGARQFVRAVTTGAPTGGTTPSVTTAAVLRLFGPDKLPAV